MEGREGPAPQNLHRSQEHKSPAPLHAVPVCSSHAPEHWSVRAPRPPPCNPSSGAAVRFLACHTRPSPLVSPQSFPLPLPTAPAVHVALLGAQQVPASSACQSFQAHTASHSDGVFFHRRPARCCAAPDSLRRLRSRLPTAGASSSQSRNRACAFGSRPHRGALEVVQVSGRRPLGCGCWFWV